MTWTNTDYFGCTPGARYADQQLEEEIAAAVAAVLPHTPQGDTMDPIRTWNRHAAPRYRVRRGTPEADLIMSQYHADLAARRPWRIPAVLSSTGRASILSG